MKKAALNRASFVDAALEVIAEVGVDKLSMRRVATHLGVSPMAMYKHYPAKEELLSDALDEFITRAAVMPEDNLPWDTWVEELGRSMYNALCTELSWVPHLGSLPLGETATSVTSAAVNKLVEAGFQPEQALAAYYGVIQVVLGAVCLRASRGQGEREQGGRELAPAMAALLEKEQIDIGLPILMDALRARLG